MNSALASPKSLEASQVPELDASPTNSAARIRSNRALWSELGLTVGAALPVVLFAAVMLLIDPGFFWNDDNQLYHVAGYYEAARAWQEGQWPLLGQSTWQGGALAGEYVNGVFSVFLQVCAILVFAFNTPFALAAAFFAIVHLAVLAMGTYRLARRRLVTVEAAYLAALVGGMNGFVVIWGALLWLPLLVSFAWVPWVWWGLEKALARSGRITHVILPGLFLYLVLSAGWPYSVVMVAVLSGWLIIRRRRLEDSPAGLGRHIGVIGGAWLVGLGLSAPAWLMLLEYSPHTLRGQVSFLRVAYGLEVPASALPALLFPAFITSWNFFEGWKPHLCAELAGGFVPLVILIAARGCRGWAPLRSVRWEAGLAVLVLLATLFPALGIFRWPFRWLPLFFLILGLIAAHVFDDLRRAKGSPPNLGLWALIFVVPCWLMALVIGRDPTWFTWNYGLLVCGLSFVWAATRWRFACLSAWMPALVLFGSSGFLLANVRPFLNAQRWPVQELCVAELDPARRYVSVHTWADIVAADDQAVMDSRRGQHPSLLPGNFATYHGLNLVGGYSPMQPLGLTQRFGFEIHGTLPERDADRLLRNDTGPQGLLASLGVDGLIVAERFEHHERHLLENGWQQIAKVPGGRIYHRRGVSLPPVWSAAAQLQVVRECRNRVELHVDNRDTEREALVVFRRPWLPGYHARLDGRPLTVETADVVLPAVRVPAGSRGQLVLDYRPNSFLIGMWIAGATLVGSCALLMLRRRTLSRKQLP